MERLHAISKAKGFRGELDELLQRMKGHRIQLLAQSPPLPRPTIAELETILAREGEKNVCVQPSGEVSVAACNLEWADDKAEVLAQHTISIRAVEDAIMRQGMVLKNIGNSPDPYPQTKLTRGTIACELYTEYCKAVGGKAFNGDALPDWDTFAADPEKHKQVEAWLVTADKAMGLAKVHPTSGGLKL